MFGLARGQSTFVRHQFNHRAAFQLRPGACSPRLLSRIRRCRRCAVPCVCKQETSPTQPPQRPFTDRLQSNAAYQRLKARKQQPQDTAAQIPSPVTETGEVNNLVAKSGDAGAPRRPEPGLSHRQKDRPVGRPDDGQRAAASQPSQSESSTPSQTEAVSHRAASVQSQAIPANKPDAIQSRASLQPLSAMPQSSQATSLSQAPVRHADFAEQQQDQKAEASVQFWLTYHAEFGQRLRVVGSHKNLGSWIMVDGPELKWTEGDRWHANVSLPSGSIYEYKYVLLDSTGMHALSWQRGNNSVLAVKQEEEELEVFDNWEGQPGAAVMAGGKSSTRESKLLNWATDIEAQLGLQRQELKRSRIELASAQEDARKARQEARAVRMELAQSQTVRAQADKLIRELQSSNRLLKSELQATTTSFKKALHVAQTMLDTAEEREDSISDRVQQADFTPTVGSSSGQPSSGQQTVPNQAMQPASTSAIPDDSLTSNTSETPGNLTQGTTQGEEGPGMSASKIPKVTKEVKGAEEAKVRGSGMQGSVAESSASSNARQQSSASQASPRPSPISQAGSYVGSKTQNTQAGHASSSSRGFSDSSPPSASSSSPVKPETPLQASSSRPQTLADMPKHGKTSAEDTVASPPKVPGGFPDSDHPSQTPSSPQEEERAGKQLEATRTAVPAHPEESNSAATQPKDLSNNLGDSAGKQLKPARTAPPVDPKDSNAAASQVVVDEPASSGVPQDQSAGQQLESAKTEIPPKVAKSNHAALEVPAAAADSKMQKEQSKGGQEGAAGQELMQGKQAIPESPNKTNPSAKSSTSNPKIAA